MTSTNCVVTFTSFGNDTESTLTSYVVGADRPSLMAHEAYTGTVFRYRSFEIVFQDDDGKIVTNHIKTQLARQQKEGHRFTVSMKLIENGTETFSATINRCYITRVVNPATEYMSGDSKLLALILKSDEIVS